MPVAEDSMLCQQCHGRCCSSGYFDYLQVSPVDISRLAKYLQITVRQLKQDHLVHCSGVWALVLTHGCMFFDKYKYRCKVYEARPQTCREFKAGGKQCESVVQVLRR